MARSWGIAMNFAFGVAGMALLGWAIQTYLWKASAPWMVIGFLTMGLVGGFVQFVRAGLREANRPDPRLGGPSPRQSDPDGPSRRGK